MVPSWIHFSSEAVPPKTVTFSTPERWRHPYIYKYILPFVGARGETFFFGNPIRIFRVLIPLQAPKSKQIQLSMATDTCIFNFAALSLKRRRNGEKYREKQTSPPAGNFRLSRRVRQKCLFPRRAPRGTPRIIYFCAVLISWRVAPPPFPLPLHTPPLENSERVGLIFPRQFPTRLLTLRSGIYKGRKKRGDKKSLDRLFGSFFFLPFIKAWREKTENKIRTTLR